MLLLSRGEKESARHGIEHLLTTAANDWNVHLVAGLTLRIDGLYDEALEQFNISLRLNPANAAIIYNHRARVYQYQNQLELAGDEIEKGLTLEPRQPLLRISLGYQQMRLGDLARAVQTLESVIADEASLRIVFPTIALCYVQLGDRKKAAGFILEETLAVAEADGEMGIPPGLPLRRRWRLAVRKRCTGCAAPSISATRTIRGSPRIPRGATWPVTATSSASSKI